MSERVTEGGLRSELGQTGTNRTGKKNPDRKKLFPRNLVQTEPEKNSRNLVQTEREKLSRSVCIDFKYNESYGVDPTCQSEPHTWRARGKMTTEHLTRNEKSGLSDGVL